MSISCLIRRASSKKPRFITVDGEVVFDATLMAGSYQHSRFGSVTKVEPHRFHGGVEDGVIEEGAALVGSCEAWWIQEPDRLSCEIDHMRLAFPGFSVVRDDGSLTWRGTIRQPLGVFDVVLTHRLDGLLPRISVLHPSRLERPEGRRFRKAPHLFMNGNLCIAHKEDWDFGRHDIVAAVSWTAHWLACYGEWRMTGQWPTTGYVE